MTAILNLVRRDQQMPEYSTSVIFWYYNQKQVISVFLSLVVIIKIQICTFGTQPWKMPISVAY